MPINRTARTAISTIVMLASIQCCVCLADDFADLKTISVLPITEQQVKTAFDRSAADACEQLPADEPLEMRNFTPYLTERDRRAEKGKQLPSTRQSVLSVGLISPLTIARTCPRSAAAR